MRTLDTTPDTASSTAAVVARATSNSVGASLCAIRRKAEQHDRLVWAERGRIPLAATEGAAKRSGCPLSHAPLQHGSDRVTGCEHCAGVLFRVFGAVLQQRGWAQERLDGRERHHNSLCPDIPAALWDALTHAGGPPEGGEADAGAPRGGEDRGAPAAGRRLRWDVVECVRRPLAAAEEPESCRAGPMLMQSVAGPG